MLTLLVACAAPGDLTGQLVDARTLGAVAHARVLATAPKADGACREAEALTGADGAFAFTGLCRGERYRITPADRSWWVPEPPEARGDVATVDLTLAAWRAPEAPGVYLLHEDQLRPLPSNIRVDDVAVPGQEGTVAVPLEVPLTPPTLSGGDALVIAGAEWIAHAHLLPLLASTRRIDAAGDTPHPIDPWFTLGARFTARGVEAVPAPVNPQGLIDVAGADRRIRYLDTRALPAGRYVLRDPASRDGWLLTFTAPDPPTP